MSKTAKTITVSFSAYERTLIVLSNLAGKDRDDAERFALAADLAVGLGGWNTDPADPYKQPYTPENAAIAGMDRHWTGTDEEEARTLRGVIAALVAEKREEADQ
jgi:hypothetical protein